VYILYNTIDRGSAVNYKIVYVSVYFIDLILCGTLISILKIIKVKIIVYMCIVEEVCISLIIGKAL